ncbi:hypothetical protein TNCV_3821751 [Trichonephila clavipes]|nr:hypothetical protein TNCV_3821751 [Trichonephila clavipes]
MDVSSGKEIGLLPEMDSRLVSRSGVAEHCVDTIYHGVSWLLLHPTALSRQDEEEASLGGPTKRLEYETPVPSVEDFISRISIANRILDMPRIFQYVKNFMQHCCQASLKQIRAPVVVQPFNKVLFVT